MKNVNNKPIAEKIVIVAHLLESVANKAVLEPLNLTMSGYKILHILNEYGSMTVSQIISCLGGTKSNVSQRLNFLEKNAYIKRIFDTEKDKRLVFILLTDQGLAKFKKARQLLKKKSLNFEELFLNKEIEQASKFLNKVFDKLVVDLK